MHSEGLDYTQIVRDHFFNPKNFVTESEIKDISFDGVGVVGSPACGDVMKMWIEVDKANDKITSCKWQTYGCASAIASTSVLSEMVIENGGMKIDDALKIKPIDIIKRLGGLPKQKIHCSVLGDQAIQKAIFDYFKKSGQEDRIKK